MSLLCKHYFRFCEVGKLRLLYVCLVSIAPLLLSHIDFDLLTGSLSQPRVNTFLQYLTFLILVFSAFPLRFFNAQYKHYRGPYVDQFSVVFPQALIG